MERIVEFKEWMIFKRKKKMKDTAAQSRVNNCLRLDEVYDLEAQYAKDECKSLLKELEYTREQESKGAAPRHQILIDGNIYDGTATLRAALNRYIEFRKDTH